MTQQISSNDLRDRFLSFFEKKGHSIQKSAPLLPQDDPTLLFINAGMAPFKDVFTGAEKRPYNKACSSQKCVRAGGKHNDLENVGRTARHHVLFEMLGNFSFGDYFKKEACLYAWEFLTKELGLDPSKLSVTVFGGEEGLPADTEAEKIWHEVVGVPKAQISRMGAADNFWAMGDTGPCGPCSEIHYDRGDLGSGFGGDDVEGDRVLEVWNLVFMQYNRQKDGTLKPLPAPCIDTGMGLERLAMVVNGLRSNYDTDLLKPTIDFLCKDLGKTYNSSDSDDDVSMRVIADHARACSFLIADGILPGNEGRGYVLRRIMRRAIRHGSKLGYSTSFFHKACALVITNMGKAYPELVEAKALISKMVVLEEETFGRTLDRGLSRFNEATKGLKKGAILSGEVAFHLYETDGFPPDLTRTIAEEKGLTIDWKAFDTAKEKHAKVSGGSLGLAGVAEIYKELHAAHGTSNFSGDSQAKCEAKVLALVQEGKEVKILNMGEQGGVLLDQTTFYAESGGQVGDSGSLSAKGLQVKVLDCQKPAGLFLHQVSVTKGTLNVGDKVSCKVDWDRRQAIRRHHSVTHLLHAALRNLLGDHVTQKGSLVAPEKLRFDYSHFEALSPAKVREVEDLVNLWILRNSETEAEVMSIDAAKKKGAMALFGEKYGNEVRVVTMGKESTELCGGSHVGRSGDIGSFKITSDKALAAGIRRLEAVAGFEALRLARDNEVLLAKAASALGARKFNLIEKLESLTQELKTAKSELKKSLGSKAGANAKEAAQKAEVLNGIKVVRELMPEGTAVPELKAYADKIRDHLQSGMVLLGAKQSEDKCMLLVALTKDLTKSQHAGKIVADLAKHIEGKGGGRPDFAQAGGKKPEGLSKALDAIKNML